MRLDKYLSTVGICTRKACAKAVKDGKILINGSPVYRQDSAVDPLSDTVTYCGEAVRYRPFFYVMLNKPIGVVSATEDTHQPTVLSLLPEYMQDKELFPCGRLDKNTTGLVLMTNDGQLSHRLLSPRHHVEKAYRFTVKFDLSAADVARLQSGIDLGAGEITKPCRIQLTDLRSGTITLTEGKYHQIKRMLEAVHNQITSLCRISFGGIPLDPALSLGEWRELTDEEITVLQNADRSIHKTDL